MQRHLSNGEDSLVARLQQVVDGNAAALADLDPALASQVVSRTNSGGDEDHPHVQFRAVGEHHFLDFALAHDFLRRLPQVDLHSQRFDFSHEQPRTSVVHLARHEARGELDHMRFQPQVESRLGGFEPQQAAADDGRLFDFLGIGQDAFQVVERAIQENSQFIDAGDWRNKWKGSRGEHDLVILDSAALVGSHDAPLAIDAAGSVTHVQLDALLAVPVEIRQHQRFGIAAGEEGGEADAVVSGPRLFAKRHDAKLTGLIVLDQPFAKPVSHHAVANDDDGFSVVCRFRNFRL